jgi:hypothetical protein
VTPIISVGDRVGGYRFESIPDGISIDPDLNGQGTVDIYVNHETSTVPFLGTSNFDNAQVSRIRLNQHSAGVLKGDLTITSAENFLRFCSNYLATAKEGFERSIFFTNEETNDLVNRTGQAWPPGPNAEQAGVVVATDVKSGQHKVIYGMGRHNHENDVAIPGYGHPVVLSGDDTFTSDPPGSQLYSYIADSASSLWNDQGDLYGFVSDNPAINDYYDFPSIEIEGDDNPMAITTEIHQPDNLETTPNGLYITEDPAGGNQGATPARLWQHNLVTGVNTPVAAVNQAADEGPTTSTRPRRRGRSARGSRPE